MSTETVIVPLERLKQLEALEAGLPDIIAKAKAEGVIENGKQRLANLTQKHKDNPKAHSEGILKKYHQNKDEINKKRREAYKNKKEQNVVA
jgi:hypothetical protein